ncbi:NTP transferase domain-containing protein [Rhodococcus spongiicola]|uniref:Molybdopterin molybdenumtransferase n=1 Tax=Rhodococcus spongiicola TaxID=2487352 RepID=A0A438B132_9NOCA|nr:NTP transferase domain-containing protein [Rhodococcus spongiicola]RVW04627.1 molybdenum cofactor biosynthesis protein [Rhodococcus spongiicola]
MGTVGTRIDAIILAGGRATRMGGVDKPAIVVGGHRMLDTALAAVDGCGRVVVVGPHRDELPDRIEQTQETPAGSGPVAALAAGLATIGGSGGDSGGDSREGFVVVLAADVPVLDRTIVSDLVARLGDHPEAAASFAVDDTGRMQFLLSVWRRRALADQLSALDGRENQPMKALVPQRYTTLAVSGVADCDTVEDLERARAIHVPGPMDVAEARTQIRTSLLPLAVRLLPLSEALGAALAAPLVAAEALPRFDVSAMDGYAVAGPGPWRLRTEVHYAGSSTDVRLASSEAVRIATGAQVPSGATAVIRDEHVNVSVDSEGTVIRRRSDVPDRDDMRRRGEDWQPGHHLAPSGVPVTPAVVSAAASAEITEASLRGPVRAHVVVTGDEIRRDGPLRDGQTRDSLGPILPDVLHHCGVRTIALAHLRDTADSFDALLRDIRDTDVIVVVGATGAGAADQLRDALARAGARVVVGRVRCRPGGSQVTALLADGRVVLGLPGNPLAAVATLLTMMPAIVDGLTARTPATPETGVVVNAAEAGAPITRIVPVARRSDGTWRADTVVRTAHLAGLIDREALALLPPDPVDGQVVELLSLPY